MRKIVVAALLLPPSIPAGAQSFDTATGNGLWQACSYEPQAVFQTGVCYGYIEGVHVMVEGITDCPPPDVVYGQSIAIVIAGLRDHPEERQLPSKRLIIKYLAAAWPCPMPWKKTP